MGRVIVTQPSRTDQWTPGGVFEWVTDWSTATGGGSTAYLDGTKWDEAAGGVTTSFGGVQGGQVVASTGLDFPTTNVYRGILYAAADPAVRNSTDVTDITTPAVGEYVHYRIYFRVASEDGVNLGIMHWWHWGGIGPLHELVAIGTVAGAGSIEFGLWGNIGGTTERITTQISPNVTYRLNITLRRNAINEARLQHMKLYDSANQLVVGTAGWTVESTTPIGDVPLSLFSDPGRVFRRFQCGPNDSSITGYSGPTNFLYVSGVAVSQSTDANAEISSYGS